MTFSVDIIGAGLAGSEAALQLAHRGIDVRLFEMRPNKQTAVHHGDKCAELVCSNSLKSLKPDSAAGMLKSELQQLESCLYKTAHDTRVAAGGALAVDREAFATAVTKMIEDNPSIELVRKEVFDLNSSADALIIASGPLTSDLLAEEIKKITGAGNLAFYDAAAPIVQTESLDHTKIFKQSRYEDEGCGDYLNAPFSKEEYEDFIAELINAERVIKKEFETADLFQACQPIEEIARKGKDAPRFGALKPVGLTNPLTGKRPWAALQLRAEDKYASSYNLVGFQTNLTFSEQKRVFRMIPGLEEAEFTRFGVMHRNTFINAPQLLDASLRLKTSPDQTKTPPIYIAGQLAGTEGYCEAIMSGLVAALAVYALFKKCSLPELPHFTAMGALLAYATDPSTVGYQPMHVNFGILPPLATKIKNKRERYQAYAQRGKESMEGYCRKLAAEDLLSKKKGCFNREQSI